MQSSLDLVKELGGQRESYSADPHISIMANSAMLVFHYQRMSSHAGPTPPCRCHAMMDAAAAPG